LAPGSHSGTQICDVSEVTEINATVLLCILDKAAVNVQLSMILFNCSIFSLPPW